MAHPMSDETTVVQTDRYELLEKIGSGGMADVHLANDTVEKRKVVLKCLKHELGDGSKYIQMFFDEARTVGNLDHPNIVKLFDVGLLEGQPFMAMEWLEGWDLRAINKRTRELETLVPIPITLRLIADACRGVHAAHRATTVSGEPLRLVHRDVSPHNLFVTTDGKLKVLDFGVAKTTIQRAKTEIRTIKGKIGYMSPEQLAGEAIDHRADIFALGLNLHELLAGKALFSGLPHEDILRAVKLDPILLPTRAAEAVPEAVARVTMRALERDLDFRYQTAEALADALCAAMEELALACDEDDVAQYMDGLFSEQRSRDAAFVKRPRARTTRVTVPMGRLDLADTREYPLPEVVNPPSAPRKATEVLGSGAPTPILLDETPSPTYPQTVVSEPPLPMWESTVVSSPPVRSFGLRPVQRKLIIAGGIGALVIMLSLAFLWTSGGDDPPVVSEALPRSVQLQTPPVLAEPAPAPAEVVSRSVPRRARAKATKPARSPRAKKLRAKTEESSVPVAPGTLTLEAVPWAFVYVGDERIGPTPLINHEFPAGKLRVRLVNEKFGVDTSAVIAIPAGGRVKRRIVLPVEAR